MSRRALRGLLIASLPLVTAAPASHAAAPTPDWIFPAGGQRGSTVSVTVAGQLAPWPVQVWTDSPGLKIEAAKEIGKLKIHVAPDAALGPHLLRLYNADGASSLRCFLVGDHRQVMEAEPNDDASKAQRLDALPVTVDGHLERVGDVDTYAVRLEAGQRLVASIQGRRLGSAIDPMLHLVDSAGTEVAYAQDGLGLDPLLVYRAPTVGTYVVRVSAFAFPPAANVQLAGGSNAIYRLSLTTGPFVRRLLPAGVRRGESSSVRLLGWNLESDHLKIDATAVPPGVGRLFVPIPGGEGRLAADVVDVPEIVEATPAPATTRPATPITLPANVSGTISAVGEEDRFTFATKKGVSYEFSLRGTAIGSPIDAMIRIEDASGKVLRQEDDAPGVSDAKCEWGAPADGTYHVVVGDLFGRGGSDYAYRLEIRRAGPGIAATADADAYALAPGKSTPIAVKVVRKNGHEAAMVAVATGLPPGVTATSAEIPAKGGDVTLTLTAAANAKPASGPIRVLLLGTDLAKPEGLIAQYDLRKDRDKAGNQEFVDSTCDLWLTVSPAAGVKAATP